MTRTVRVRLGIVGCGALATAVHIRNARRFPDVSVTAIADPLETARDRAGRLAPHAVRLQSADELLARDDVDAVVVASPPSTHATFGIQALAAGKHLYLEKPVATTLDEAELLAAAAAAADSVATVGFNRRFHPLILAAREHLERGALGAILAVRTRFDEPLADAHLPAWKRTRVTGGGAPLDLASHHVDLVRHLLHAELEAEASELRSRRSELDDCTLLFRAGGAPVRIECSFFGRPRDLLAFDGEGGSTLTIDRYVGRIEIDGRRARWPGGATERMRALVRPRADLSYRPALRAFVDRILGADPPLATVEDGIASLRAVLAAETLDTVLT